MRIGRLRLVGFKSFADATELTIEPGLTGIVGPNGCGKSNLVEALRWVMGETSARRLRGGEMDDVIFAGAGGRPARNIAEVVLTIDNSARDTRTFDDRDEIEVGRRIERGGGSVYRVNGREARARDVQLLFADAASGGQSWAIVGQGRVSALIDAKPADRRLLLEEAAGTAGLQARRREAEIKLQAVEQNLARLDEVAATAARQLAALQNQARRAKRYRRLAEQIRRSEALLLHARWSAAQTAVEDAAARLRQAERFVAETAEAAAVRQRAYENAEAAMPVLRSADGEAAAELQRLSQTRNGLETELQRVLSARGDAERRCRELADDLKREDVRAADASAALARLSAERKTLISAGSAAGAAQTGAIARHCAAAERAAAAETSLRDATDAAADDAARRLACLRRRRELDERLGRLGARAGETERQRAAAAGAMAPPLALAAAQEAVAEAERQLANADAAVRSGESGMAAYRAGEAAALDKLRSVEARLARLTAEAAALQALLGPAPQAIGHTPILTGLQVAEGFEAAIGAIFDDELAAPSAVGDGADAPCFWIELPAIDGVHSLPDGARSLAEVVNAPPALGRSLAHAGWVEDEATGRRLQPRLAPGQRLVDRDGRLWRWDGFTRIAAAPSAAAQKLRHKRRLAVLAVEIAQAEAAARSTGARVDAARAEARRAVAADDAARAQLRRAEATLADARGSEAGLARRAFTAETRLATLVDAADKLAAELGEIQAQVEENERDLAALPEPGPAQAVLEAARAQAAQARRQEAAAQTEIELSAQEARSRAGRLAAIDAEESAWRNQALSATAQGAALVQRRSEIEQEIAALAARPAMIAAESEALGARIADGAANAERSASALALGETRRREAAEGRHVAQQAMAQGREDHARLEAQHGGACETSARLAREIGERLAVGPEALAAIAGLSGGEDPAEVAETAVRLDRLRRERDGVGPVNLVAESEAAEIEAQVCAMRREQAELTQAVARLRRGIATLDQEARRRLAAAFERVNSHFAELFARLFGGGKAQLSLTEPFNPLTAGLEIMASPAGKRPQMLSLLSGGEQALTALALIFAFFLTNPAPVCILDEVDAPLDDANVERLCGLVAEIAERTGTRFLLVTHHRITMARVDRLFGVTMIEPGVSQLVSVELARAARLRQTA